MVKNFSTYHPQEGYHLSATGIEEAYHRIGPQVNETPILTSKSLNRTFAEICGYEGRESEAPKLYFKCENFQKTGSFKCRGAVNAVNKALDNPDTSFFGRPNGFITHSSGNHGQALAYACAQRNVRCIVVVPENAPKSKITASERLGATVLPLPGTPDERIKKCMKMAKSENLMFIDPYDNWDVMEAQGTVALEFNEQVPELDVFVAAVGGGGLAAGASQWFSERNPRVKVFCVEPEGKESAKSLQAGRRLWTTNEPLDTIADGARIRALGERCFKVLKKHGEKQVFSVTNAEIQAAWKLIWERLKVVVEPCAAMPLAAVMKYPEHFKAYKHIGLILCGGNVDFAHQF